MRNKGIGQMKGWDRDVGWEYRIGFGHEDKSKS